MITLPAIALNTISSAQLQREVTFNEIMASMSRAFLFGVKQRETSGLRLTLYGGVFPALSGPLQVADTHITLTASTTNYISVDTNGAVSKVTAAPTGWPGPMPTGATALYQLTVGADAITSGTCYILGVGQKDVTGAQGAIGPAGAELWQTRKLLWELDGFGNTQIQELGWSVTSSGFAARSADSSTFHGSIAHAFGGGGGGSHRVGSYYSNLWCHGGNAVGRGGYKLTMRLGINTTDTAQTHGNMFWGLSAAPPQVEDAISNYVNIFGIGFDDGESVWSLIHNDGTGTGTKSTLVSDDVTHVNFASKNADNTYELVIESVSNSGTIDYSLTQIDTGLVSSGSVSTDIPSTSTFLAWEIFTSNNASTGSWGFNMMQISGEMRY